MKDNQTLQLTRMTRPVCLDRVPAHMDMRERMLMCQWSIDYWLVMIDNSQSLCAKCRKAVVGANGTAQRERCRALLAEAERNLANCDKRYEREQARWRELRARMGVA